MLQKPIRRQKGTMGRSVRRRAGSSEWSPGRIQSYMVALKTARQGQLHPLSEETRVEVVVKKQKCSAEKHVCEECGSEFEKTGNFNRHVKDLHSEKEGGWGCKKHKFCYEKFSTKHEMLLHKAGCRFRRPNWVWSTDRSDRIDLHLKVCK